MRRRAAFQLCLLLSLCLVGKVQPSVEGPRDYGASVQAIESFIAQQLDEQGLPSIAVALVDEQGIVWAKGFGHANLRERRPATADTVYVVGGISELLVDLAVMRLVEQSALRLDAPVIVYAPDFQPKNRFEMPVTLRQLMAHCSGLVREPPIGHYFERKLQPLADIVQSLSQTELVYKPGSRTKYSNAGNAIVRYVLERAQGKPAADYIRRIVLEPIGLGRSALADTTALTDSFAEGLMWTYHGRTFPVRPEGCATSTVTDLGKLLKGLLSRDGQILKPATLEQMWQVQFPTADTKQGLGLGWRIAEMDGRQRVSCAGAVYGFAAEIAAVPEKKLGVAVIGNKDQANATIEQIATLALRHMLAVCDGKALPKVEEIKLLSPEMMQKLPGRYRKGVDGFDLVATSGKLYAWPARGGVRLELRRQGDNLISDGPLSFGVLFRSQDDQLITDKVSFSRVTTAKPPPALERWKGLIGEYGWDHSVLYILEKDGRLHALIDWFYLYPLEQIAENVFRFPAWGRYQGEKLTFARLPNGQVSQVLLEGVAFPRRHIDGENGATFQIRPLRPVEVIRQEALAAKPPLEGIAFRDPDLVEVSKLDPTIKLDIRYAASNNFLGTPLYSSARAFLQRPAAQAVVRAHRKLASQGYGLLIHDGYRPWYVTKMFWDATPAEHHVFVADPLQGSRHNRGCAVDLTLFNLQTGKIVEMVGGYDEFSDRSYPEYPGGSSLQRWHRELLRRAMENEGFTVYEAEWWHFDYCDWKKYPILNRTFEELANSSSRP